MEFSEGNISGGTSEDKVFEEITPPSNSQGEDTSAKEPSVAETDAADGSSVSYSIEDAIVPAEEDRPYFAACASTRFISSLVKRRIGNPPVSLFRFILPYYAKNLKFFCNISCNKFESVLN